MRGCILYHMKKILSLLSVVALSTFAQADHHGEKAGTDLNDPIGFKSHPKDFLGLQVHGIGKNKGPFSVAWKNIKIKELKQSVRI